MSSKKKGAAEGLDVSKRQARRIKKRYLSLGPQGLTHKNKLRKPVNKLDPKILMKLLEFFMDWKNNTDDGLNSAHTVGTENLIQWQL